MSEKLPDPAVSARGSGEAPWYWDRYRRTTVGRYLFQREHAFVDRALRESFRRDQPARVLDVGCGSGRLTAAVRRGGWAVVGLDRDPGALAALRRALPWAPAVCADGAALPFRNGSFDAIVAAQAFEYLPHAAFLAEAQRVLRDGGVLVFDALNRHSYKALLKHAAGRRLDRPSANLGVGEIVGALVASGFAVQRVRGYNWLPFTRQSDSFLVPGLAVLEERLHLGRLVAMSPKVLVAARKVGADTPSRRLPPRDRRGPTERGPSPADRAGEEPAVGGPGDEGRASG